MDSDKLFVEILISEVKQGTLSIEQVPENLREEVINAMENN